MLSTGSPWVRSVRDSFEVCGKRRSVPGYGTASSSTSPGMGLISRVKAATEPTSARRAHARKKVWDGSEGSRMARSALPSELSSRQAEQEGSGREGLEGGSTARYLETNLYDPHGGRRFSAHLGIQLMPPFASKSFLVFSERA
jgi:hypothetical protein